MGDVIHAAEPHRITFSQKIGRIWPLGPIFGKELRQMARRKRSYFLRFAYLGLLLLLLLFAWLVMNEGASYRAQSIVAQANQQAEMGRVFFCVFAMFSIVAMHLIGPILTSTAIGSERLHRTLDVLLMTPINAWQIVGGKLFSRLLSAVVLLGLSLPVLAIVRLLGGVELEEMFGMLALALATALGSAAIGLLLSCFLKRAWAVILLAFFIQGLIYGLFPMLVMFLLSTLFRTGGGPPPVGAFTWIAASNPIFTTAAKIFGRGGIPIRLEWSYAITFQLVLAALLTLIAAALVRRTQRMLQSESSPTAPPMAAPIEDAALPPPLPGDTLAYAGPATNRVRRPRTPRAVWNNPVLWSELRRPMLSRRWQRITVSGIMIGLLLLTYAVFSAASYGRNELLDEDMHIGYVFTLHSILLLVTCVISSTSIATEKESDTWTLLIASPLTGRQVLMGKCLGILRRLIGPYALLVIHLVIFTVVGVLTPTTTLLVLWIALTTNLLWLATGVYLSLRLKRVTSAVICNLLLPVLLYGLVPLLLAIAQIVITGGTYGPDWAEGTLYGLPYYYEGEAINKLSDRSYTYSGYYTSSTSEHFYAPMGGGQQPIEYLIGLAVVVGLAYTAISAAIIGWASLRFDAIVKRARQGA